jgi:hypothetical protein
VLGSGRRLFPEGVEVACDSSTASSRQPAW